ncbi:hypothetical protein KOW79_005942 [Hemibagrus wyckioides]|uniref:Coiled-coil domain-containing protein 39 n=1 Tax=Hemibagrus wyckioides TaxID=337641 RepID=A0A9D3SNF7_9TELE|nr:hypothetical protein KOW79_005942 [Hemibagrus wyckioides]
MDNAVISGLLAEIGWNTNLTFNAENKALLDEIQRKQKDRANVENRVSKLKDRISAMTEHTTNVQQERIHSQALCRAVEKQTESGLHFKALSDREKGRLRQEISQQQSELKSLRERKNSKENNIFKATQKIEVLKGQVNMDQQTLDAWLEESARKDEDIMTIVKYAHQDESRIRELTLNIDKQTLEANRKRKTLENEATETIMAQVAVEKTAELVQQANVERQELITQWENSIAQMRKKDQDIHQCALLQVETKQTICERKALLNEKQNFLAYEVDNNKDCEKKIAAAERQANTLWQQFQEEESNRTRLQDEARSYSCIGYSTSPTCLKGEVNRTATDLEAKRSHLASIKKDINIKTAKLEDRQRYIIALKAKLQGVTEEALSVEERAAQMEKLHRDLKKHLKELNTQIQREKKLLSQKTQELQTLREKEKNEFQIQYLEEKMARLSGNVNEEEKQVLENQVSELSAVLEEKKRAADLLAAQLKKLQNDIRFVGKENEKTEADKQDLTTKIEELNLVDDTLNKELKRLCLKKQDSIVENNIQQLQVKRLRTLLYDRADGVLSQEKRKLKLQKLMKEQQKEICVYQKMCTKQLKITEQEIQRLSAQLYERLSKVDKMKKKYEIVNISMAAPEGEEDKSQAYYIIKAAQEKEELQCKGDDLDAKIRMIEKENKALENTMHLLNNHNSAYRKSIKESSPEYQEKLKLEEQKRAADEKGKFKRRQIRELQENFEVMSSSLNSLQQEEGVERHRKADLETQVVSFKAELISQQEKWDRATKQSLKLTKEVRSSKNTKKETFEERDLNQKVLKDCKKTVNKLFLEVMEQHPDLQETLQTYFMQAGLALPSPAPTPSSRSSKLSSARSSVSLRSSRFSGPSAANSARRLAVHSPSVKKVDLGLGLAVSSTLSPQPLGSDRSMYPFRIGVRALARSSVPLDKDKANSILQQIQRKQKDRANVENRVSKLKDRISAMTEHTTNVQQERIHSQALCRAVEKQTESGLHFKALSDREKGRLRQEISQQQSELKSLRERKNSKENNIFKATQKIEVLKGQVNMDQQTLDAWLEESARKDEDIMTIVKYAHQDESRIRELTLNIDKQTLEANRKRKTLENEATETIMAQVAVEKTAELVQQANVERQELITQWENSIKQMRKKDQDIHQCALLQVETKHTICERKALLNEKQNFLAYEVDNNKDCEKKIAAAERQANTLWQQFQEEESNRTRLQDEACSYSCIGYSTSPTCLKGEVNRTATDLEAKRSHLASIKKDINIKTAKLEDRQRYIIALKAKLQGVTEEALSVEERAAQMEKLHRDLKKHLKELNTQIQREKKLLSQKTQELQTLRAKEKNEFQIQYLEEKMARLSGNVNEEEKQVLENQVSELSAVLEEKKRAADLLAAQLKKLQNDIRFVGKENEKTEADKQDLTTKIEELNLVDDTLNKELKRLCLKKQDSIVENNIQQLQVKRLRTLLYDRADGVLSQEKRKLKLQKLMKEQQKEICVYQKMCTKQLKITEQEIQRLSAQLYERLSKVDKMKKKYEIVNISMAAPEGEEDKSQAYYIIKAAQEKEELQCKGDDLDAKIRMIEKENKALENTMHLLNNHNSAYRKSIKESSPEYQEKLKLEEQKRAADEKGKFKRRQIRELQENFEVMSSSLNSLQQEEGVERHRKADLETQVVSFKAELISQQEKWDRATKQSLKLTKEIRSSKNTKKETFEERDLNQKVLKDCKKTVNKLFLEVMEQHPDLQETLQTYFMQAGLALPSPAPTPSSRSSKLSSARSSVSLRSSRFPRPSAANSARGLAVHSPSVKKIDLGLGLATGQSVPELGLLGGVDVKDTVWRIMRQPIKNDLAKAVNWRGVNGKTLFQTLELKNIVIEAVRRNPVCAQTSECHNTHGDREQIQHGF